MYSSAVHIKYSIYKCIRKDIVAKNLMSASEESRRIRRISDSCTSSFEDTILLELEAQNL